MSLRALLFDVDGTLADTEEAHRQAFNAAFVQHGLEWAWNPQEYAELLKVSGGKERIACFIEQLKLPDAERSRLKRLIAEVHRSKTLLYARYVAAGAVPLRPGVERLLREASAAGLKLAVASTTSVQNVQALLKAAFAGCAPVRFDVIAAGDQVPLKKPAPDIYVRALGGLGLTAAQCMAFEDSANGLAAAKAAGLFTVVTPTCWTEAEDLAAADLRLRTLSDVDGLEELAGRHARARLEQRSAA